MWPLQRLYLLFPFLDRPKHDRRQAIANADRALTKVRNLKKYTVGRIGWRGVQSMIRHNQMCLPFEFECLSAEWDMFLTGTSSCEISC